VATCAILSAEADDPSQRQPTHVHPLQSEIEKNVSKGMDIDAYVKIGDKGVKTSQRQMDDPTGGYAFMNYDAPSKKLYRKNMLIKTIK
jgi:hypothetical protein